MVYHGPSTGCSTCKERRVKCDKGRPQCQNCLKRNKTCPGYAGVFDRVHRDQNELVVQRIRRNRKQTNQTTSKESLSVPIVALVKPSLPVEAQRKGLTFVAHEWRPKFGSWTKLPATIPNDYKLACIDFFLTNYTNTISEPEVGGGFMRQILPVMSTAPVHSPVHDAVTAVAVTIVNLWAMRGCDTFLIRSSYVEALMGLRKALLDPEQNISDHVLMAAILLAFFESLSAQFSKTPPRNSSHIFGALALIEQRGRANFSTETGRSLLVSSRSGMVHHSIHTKQALPASSETWFRHPDIPNDTGDTGNDLNVLGIDLAKLLAEMEHASQMLKPARRQEQFAKLISEALSLDKKHLQWDNNRPDHWRSVMLEGTEIPASVREAGVYEDRCSVYQNLCIAEGMNIWRSRRIILLRSIRRCYSTCSKEVQLLHPGIIERLQDDLQAMADGICESIPFYLGDAVDPLDPLQWNDITFPRTLTKSRAVPDEKADHAREAVVAGGWFLRTPLLTLIGEAKDHDEMPLRDGQWQWIQEQTERLARVWTFPYSSLDANTLC